jgi:hypothetical protein
MSGEVQVMKLLIGQNNNKNKLQVVERDNRKLLLIACYKRTIALNTVTLKYFHKKKKILNSQFGT